MWIKFTNPTFYYIDPSQEYIAQIWNPADHDGSSVAKADRALPATLQNNTVYLIRRTDPDDVEKWCNLTQVVSSEENANHIAIMGMPRESIQLTEKNIQWYIGKEYACSSTQNGTYEVAEITDENIGSWIKEDDLYAYMPADAKEAWSSDEYERATIAEGVDFRSEKNFITLKARGVYFSNIELKQRFKHWDGYGLPSDVKYSPYSYVLALNAESIHVNRCRFVVIGSDLTKDQHDNFENSSYSYKSTHRVHMSYRTSCKFYNNEIIASPSCNNDRGCIQFYFDTKDGKTYINNIIVHNTGVSNDSMSAILNFTQDSSTKRDITTIQNITEYIYKCTTSDAKYRRLRPLLDGWFFDGSIKNITVQFSKDETTATNWPLINHTHISVSLRSEAFRIGNLTADLPEYRGNVNMFSFWKSYIDSNNGTRHAPTNQWFIVQDIIANFSEYGTMGVDGGGDTVLSIGDDVINRDYSNWNDHDSTCRQIILQNVNINAPMSSGLALYARYVLINMEENDIGGRVNFANCIGKIGKITSYYVGNAFVDEGFNLIYCDGIICNKNNPDTTYNGQQALSPSWYSNILVKSTNTVFIADTTKDTGTANSTNCLYVCPSDQSEGQFTVRNPVSKAQAWSVNRTGGHQCSLRLTCHEGSSEGTQDPHLVIGGGPFKGIKANLKKGLNKCTIYFTGYGYNNFYDLPKYARIEAKRPDGTVVGGDCGLWEEDTTSEWNNIDNNLSMKYTMYIDMDEDGAVEFTYRFWWNIQMDAYTFIDPFPIVEQIAE